MGTASRGGRPPIGVAMGVVLLLSSLLGTAVARADDEAPKLAWVPPTALRTFRWSASADSAGEPVQQPAGAVRLGAGELLVAAVSRGERVRVDGAGLVVGFGSGAGPLPDVVLWTDTDASRTSRDLRVPTWGSVRFVVVRAAGDQPSQVRVWLAAARSEPLAWYRADDAVGRWLATPDAPPPELARSIESGPPLLRRLAAARRALGTVGDGDAARALLGAEWLAATLRQRPTNRPFFTGADVRLSGATPVEPTVGSEAQPGETIRLGRSGEVVRVRSDQADVVRVRVRARTLGTTTLRIHEGGRFVRELRITVPIRAYDRTGWTAPYHLRLVVPPRMAARVEVVRGTAQLAFRGYRLVTGALDGDGWRNRRALLGRAARAGQGGSAADRVVRTLARSERRPSARRLRELQSLGGDGSLSGGLRALVSQAALRHAATALAKEKALAELWQATASLALRDQLPIRRAALEHVVRTRRGPLSDPKSIAAIGRFRTAAAPPAAELRDDHEVVKLLEGVVVPDRDRRRPVHGHRAEARAALDGPGSAATGRAALVWRGTAPWSNLPPTQAAGTTTRMVPVLVERQGERCPLQGEMGLRWLELGPTPRRLHVDDMGGTHTRIRMIVDPEQARRDAVVQLDELSAMVHGAAGLRSTVAVKPGPRQLRVVSGPPVLARVPSSDEVDCRLLREGLRWVQARDRAIFAIDAGEVTTVASLIVADEAISAATTLRIRVGPATHLAWVRPPATGAVEVPVPPRQTHVTVEGNQPLLLRLRARLHRRAGPQLRTPSVAVSAPPAEATLIDRVRQSTRALRASRTKGAAARQRLARARVLERLGYGRLAAADRARAGSAAPAAAGGQGTSTYAAELPPGSEAVVPIGDLPRIEPLPPPADDAHLRKALAARQLGATDAEVVALLRPAAEQSAAADALLLAVNAEQVGLLELAATSLERIGRAHQSGHALARAAQVRIRLARHSRDHQHSLLAYLTARDALALGGSAEGSLARLSRAIGWDRAQADRAAGSALVEQLRVDDEEASLGQRVRRALVDAPSYAALTRGSSVVVGLRRVEAEQLRLDWVCRSLEGNLEPCAMTIAIDRQPVECHPTTVSVGATAGNTPARGSNKGEAHHPWVDSIARPMGCRIALPAEARRLTVSPPQTGELIAWVGVRAVVEAELVPVTAITRWTEIEPQRPFQTVIAGPTALRIAVRTAPGRTAPLELRIVDRDDPAKVETRAIALDTREDPSARRFRSQRPLSQAAVHYVTIHQRGRFTVSLASPRGRALVRLAAARAVGLPRPPRSAAPVEAPPAPRAPDQGRALAHRRAPVGWDGDDRWLTVGASASFVSRELIEGDADGRDDFGELAFHLRRELVPGRLWTRASLFGRVRDGPISQGGEVRLSLASRDWLPGGFAGARLVGQTVDEQWAVGGYLSAGLLWTAPIHSSLSLTPIAVLSMRWADETARRGEGVDRQVYSAYSESRPRSLDFMLRATHRPYVDLYTRYTARTRLTPDMDGVDNVGLQIQTDLLAGAGLIPWVRLDSLVSYRPVSAQRTRSYARAALSPAVTFWQWLASFGRVSLEAGVSAHVDMPAISERRGGLSGSVTVGYDHLMGRGLRDFSPSERPFHQRLEEPYGKVDRRSRSAPAEWGESP